MKSLNFDYYYGSEAEQFIFYRIPKALMAEPHFKKLSSDAKILYGLMPDRMGLSIKNEWIDKDNKVYIFFTLEDVQESLNCSHTTGVKILAELDAENGIGLIQRVKQGQGKPARIYVKNFNISVENSVDNFENIGDGSQDIKKAEVKTSKTLKSRTQENGSADFQNIDANQTNSNNNKYNNIEYQSIYPPIQPHFTQPKMDLIDMIDIMDNYRKFIHRNIEYEILIERYDSHSIDEYVQIMLDAICSQNETVRVDCAKYPVEAVKNRLLKLDSSHIEYVLISMNKNTTKVRNIKNYLLTALYNSYTTIDSFFKAEVNHDLYGNNKRIPT